MPIKRAFGIDPANVIDGWRPGKKRRDEDLPEAESSSPRDVDMADTPDVGPRQSDDLEAVRDSGRSIWNVVKEVRSKE
jgi:hypothetical protein